VRPSSILGTGGAVPGEARRTAVPVPAAVRTGAGRTPEGAAWIDELPALVARARDRWSLTPGDPFPSGSASWCAPVRDPAGTDLVLKISFPHAEARDEAAVLRAWQGRGAVRLVDEHAPDWALLLERVRPGTPLRAARTPVPRRLAEAADVLRALHAEPAAAGLGDLPGLADVAAGWATLVEHRAETALAAGARPDPGQVRAAVAVLRAATPAGAVVLHGDLNPGNLLRTRDGWIAIDPKPLRGDPAYDPWPLLEQVGEPWRAPDPVRALRDRLRLVADRAGLDPVAAAGWALARGTEAALWGWAHDADAARLHRALRRAADWARVRDALAG
jgi:streptomycin 6-kinase